METEADPLVVYRTTGWDKDPERTTRFVTTLLPRLSRPWRTHERPSPGRSTLGLGARLRKMSESSPLSNPTDRGRCAP